MALYVGMSVLAVLLAVPSESLADRSAAITVFLAGVALVIAHQVAFRMSTRLVSRGRIDSVARRSLSAQLAGGVIIAALAAAPILLVGRAGALVSMLLLVGLVAGVGFLAMRSAGRGRWQAAVYAVAVVIVVALVLALKSLVAH